MKKNTLMILFLLALVPFISAQDTTVQGANAQGMADKNVTAKFFYLPTCSHCANAEVKLEELEEKYDFLQIERYNMNDNYALVKSLYEQYNVPAEYWGGVPIIFLETKYIFGDNEIIENLEAEVLKIREGSCEPPITPDSGCETKEISILQLAGLAAVDAVNPCELSVLILLMVAVLSRFPDKKEKALKAGLAFSLGVFLMYLSFGILIILGFKTVVGFAGIKGSWFYTALAAFAIILGLLNLKDAVWYKGGGFVMEVPFSWRPKMKEQILKGSASTVTAFMAGIIVSFFLSPCTAGPYFVAGGILAGHPFIEALPYLLFYLSIFIAPMLAITFITYFGLMKLEDMAEWKERNIKKLHWVAGLLLVGLGAAMLLGLL